MANAKFSKLKLKADKSKKTITIKNEEKGLELEVEVLQYLPFVEKATLVSRVVQKGIIEGTVRKDLVECAMMMEIIFNYTNLEFTDAQKEKELDLYDILESNGVFSLVLDSIPEIEKNEINNAVFDYVEQMKEILSNSYSGYTANSEAAKDAVKLLVEQALEKDLDLDPILNK